MKSKSLEELKDCLDLLCEQLQSSFYRDKPNMKHVNKINGWIDRITNEIQYRNTTTEYHRNYNTKP